MEHRPLRGPLAALLTPRTASGELDCAALERGVNFALENGASGVVVNGGTGEYAAQSLEERKLVAEHAARSAAGDGLFVVGIGSMATAEAVELGRHALGLGADAVLLPPPHFYRYEQQDLAAFFRAAATALNGPVVLYNLAAFVTPIETATALELLHGVGNIVGVKDSSGRLDLVERMTVEETPGIRILGHDAVIGEGLRRGWIDATISGPTAVAPELMRGLFTAAEAGDAANLDRLAAYLEELVEKIGEFPYPWPLVWAAGRRGFAAPHLALPLSAERRRQADEFANWFERWLERIRDALQ